MPLLRNCSISSGLGYIINISDDTYLKGIALPVLGHDLNDLAAIAKLAHFARTPSIDISFVSSLPAVLPQEIFEVIATVIWHQF
jgi:hypothetical protein